MRFFIFCLFVTCFPIYAITAQPLLYTSANAHSHNDYEQPRPFTQAYDEQFGSMEADIYLVNGKLLVGHNPSDLTPPRTLEQLYLLPLKAMVEKNHGYAYADKTRSLQLLIDVKSDSLNTLNALVKLLKHYPSISKNRSVKIVVTGNRPAPEHYKDYPAFIWFDGRLNQQYSSSALAKIALLSDNLNDYVKWKGEAPMDIEAHNKILSLVKKSHRLKKPVRFWAIPDNREGWREMEKLTVDYLNTDHIENLTDFLSLENDSLQLLPYNRIIRSAGKVIRFGNRELENHALDVAALGKSSVVIEDRYGIVAMDPVKNKILQRWSLLDDPRYRGYMSTYSGIKTLTENGHTWVLWSVAGRENKGAILIAEWNGEFQHFSEIMLTNKLPATNPLPNDLAIAWEKGQAFIYVVLNGNNELLKIRWSDKTIVWRSETGVAPYGVALINGRVYVSNWAGQKVTDSTKESAGVPWGLAYTDPRTGATAAGTVSVFDAQSGTLLKDIPVGLHPNSLLGNKNHRYLYVANGSSDQVSVIDTRVNQVVETIDVGLLYNNSLQGSTPNALELSADNTRLYVANGFDNAIAVVRLGSGSSTNRRSKSTVVGYIPTEAYPGGIKLVKDRLVVTNLESGGANVIDQKNGARSIHNQLASVSIIPLPRASLLKSYSASVANRSLLKRATQLLLTPSKNKQPVPLPERLGEPSVFKHVVYIIKENKTYDQVFGDIPKARGDSSLCIFGGQVTPNAHALAKQFGWMDDYYASGKSSAEGHQWTDAGMVSDYIEKSVRAWFRSYPHRQEDALVYNKSGFIWNQALDHGKSVKIYGEACKTVYNNSSKWPDLYTHYKNGKEATWHNTTTIARIRSIISPDYPDCDNLAFSDQQRADIFIRDWKLFEQNGDLPNLVILSLPNDHTAGTSPDFPTPDAMVADNDLAVGRIVEVISKSRYWDSTVIFITQDDSQSGWDHISAYRTVGLVLSAYSPGKLVSSNYNQTSMLRTMEQILGIPPMNVMDATARLMTACFTTKKKVFTYTALPSNVPLDKMNKGLKDLSGIAKSFALQSQKEVFNEVDGGKDDAMNRIIWFYARGTARYPVTK